MSKDFQSLFTVASALVSFNLTKLFFFNCACKTKIEEAVSQFDNTLEKIEKLPSLCHVEQKAWCGNVKKARCHVSDFLESSSFAMTAVIPVQFLTLL